MWRRSHPPGSLPPDASRRTFPSGCSDPCGRPPGASSVGTCPTWERDSALGVVGTPERVDGVLAGVALSGLLPERRKLGRTAGDLVIGIGVDRLRLAAAPVVRLEIRRAPRLVHRAS